jgi:hypothetical protein
MHGHPPQGGESVAEIQKRFRRYEKGEQLMKPMKAVKASRLGRRALLLGGIGILSAGSVAGVSYALTSSTSGPATAQVAATTSSSQKGSTTTPKVSRPYQRARAVLRRAVSGEVELATKSGFVTIDFDRGSVTSISGSSITILRPDGVSVTDAINSATHMPKRGVPTKGENVVMVSHSGNALYLFKVGPFDQTKAGSTKSGGSSSSTSSSSGAASNSVSL